MCIPILSFMSASLINGPDRAFAEAHLFECIVRELGFSNLSPLAHDDCLHRFLQRAQWSCGLATADARRIAPLQTTEDLWNTRPIFALNACPWPACPSPALWFRMLWRVSRPPRRFSRDPRFALADQSVPSLSCSRPRLTSPLPITLQQPDGFFIV